MPIGREDSPGLAPVEPAARALGIRPSVARLGPEPVGRILDSLPVIAGRAPSAQANVRKRKGAPSSSSAPGSSRWASLLGRPLFSTRRTAAQPPKPPTRAGPRVMWVRHPARLIPPNSSKPAFRPPGLSASAGGGAHRPGGPLALDQFGLAKALREGAVAEPLICAECAASIFCLQTRCLETCSAT